MVDIPNSADEDVYSFVRGEGADRVFAVFNLSEREHTVTFDFARHHGDLTDAMSGEAMSFGEDTSLSLGAWDYQIYTAD